MAFPILHAFPARPGERGSLPHISRRFDARRLGPGEWPDPSGIRVVRRHVLVGHHGRLVDRPGVRLLPGARGARRSRGNGEDEGDREGDPGGREGVPVPPVPDARGVPRPADRRSCSSSCRRRRTPCTPSSRSSSGGRSRSSWGRSSAPTPGTSGCGWPCGPTSGRRTRPASRASRRRCGSRSAPAAWPACSRSVSVCSARP